MIEDKEIQTERKQYSPLITLISLLAVMILLCIIMFFFPKKGITIADSTINFPTINSFFVPKMEEDSLSKMEEDLAILFDSTIVVNKIDSAIIKHKLDSLKQHRQSLQLNNDGQSAMNRFFAALDNAKNKKVRIMHYGDSQIEADRITSYLRNELQKKFGGYGTGLFPIIQVAPKMSVNTEYSENWKRYPGFGRKDSTVSHMKYGALMAFCRYAPIPQSEISNDAMKHEAWLKIKKPRASYGRTKSYHQLKVFLSNSHSNIRYKITADGVDLIKGIISANTPFQTLKANFDKTPEEITITFKGKDSPDIYGISLEGNNGIVMDNIPLRGSSGTIFTKQNGTLLSNMYANLSPSLILMEFGGNTIPYIKNEKAASDYGRWFKSQINFMKKRNPQAAIIVIGPGDMSIKEGTDFVTYPLLENVRDALKDAAISSGCVFWDMYEVMGGKNSMPKWVNAEPSLAASDYIHFSPKGAKKIAEEFNVKLFGMYNQYKGIKVKSNKVESRKSKMDSLKSLISNK
jgi:lysophospholipase L1-like esterase/biopolymer transport protein ExbD